MKGCNQIILNLSNLEKLCSEAREIASFFLPLYKKDKTFQIWINSLLKEFNQWRKFKLELKDIIDAYDLNVKSFEKLALLKEFFDKCLTNFDLWFILSSNECIWIQWSIKDNVHNAIFTTDLSTQRITESQLFLDAVKNFLLEVKSNIQKIVDNRLYESKKEEIKKPKTKKTKTKKPEIDKTIDKTSIDLVWENKDEINNLSVKELKDKQEQLRNELVKILGELNKKNTIGFLKNFELELKNDVKFRKIIWAKKTESVIKNAIAFGNKISIIEDKKIYMNLYNVLSTKTVTKLSVENIILISSCLAKNNFNLNKIFWSNFDISIENYSANEENVVEDSWETHKIILDDLPKLWAAVEKVRVPPSTWNRGEVIYFSNVSENNKNWNNLDLEGINISEFIPLLQAEINKILLEKHKWDKPLDEEIINNYTIHEWSLESLFSWRKDRKIYINMFDKLPKKVRESKSWLRILNLLSWWKNDKSIWIAMLNEFVSKYLIKNDK